MVLLILNILHFMATILSKKSSPYTLQAYLSIRRQVIYSGEIVYEVTYFVPINTNSRYYVLQRTKSINTIFSLRTIINGNFNLICYGFMLFLRV